MKIFKKIKQVLCQVFCKKDPLEPDSIIQTEFLSASEFALATGIKIEYFTDTQEDSLNSTIISSKSVQSNAVCSSSAFPKLDMNIFIPPAKYKSSNERIETNRELFSLSAPIRRGRRASDIGSAQSPIFFTKGRNSVDDSLPSLSRVNTDETLISDNHDVTVQTKGRFVLITEKSFQWQVKSSSLLRASRFKYVPEESEECPRERKDSGIELAT